MHIYIYIYFFLFIFFCIHEAPLQAGPPSAGGARTQEALGEVPVEGPAGKVAHRDEYLYVMPHHICMCIYKHI